MPRRLSSSVQLAFIVVLLGVTLLPTTAVPVAAKSSGATVQLKEFKFLPDAITVK